MLRQNTLKQRLRQGEKTFGAWISTGSAAAAELLSLLGFDFLILDLEHGPGDLATCVDMLRAAQPNTPCIVRVPSNDPVFLKRVLEAGVDGVMIPQIENAREAEAAVRACRYPPAGIRGYAAGAVRASGYGVVADYIHRAADELLIVLQIESKAAVTVADAICAVEGIDVVFIGVNDLAGSIGRLEQLDHADVRALVRQVEATMRQAGKIMGTVPSAGASPQDLFNDGYQLVPITSDVVLLSVGVKAAVAEARSMVTRR